MITGISIHDDDNCDDQTDSNTNNDNNSNKHNITYNDNKQCN